MKLVKLLRCYLARKTYPVKFHDLSRTNPISRQFGMDRGTPIDRYYIEKYLNLRRLHIKGKVIEVGGMEYIRKFGNLVVDKWSLDYKEKKGMGNRLVANLEDPETMPENFVDCIIATQVLNFIFDVKKALNSTRKLLRKNGCLLGTVAGGSQISRYDADRWGDYWRFTAMSLDRLLREVFPADNIEIKSFGNVLAATSFLQGIAVEDLPDVKMLDELDEDYPIVLGFKVQKD